MIRIPEELRGVPVTDLPLSIYARNRLLSNNIDRLGKLHGRAFEEIATFSYVGVRTLRELEHLLHGLGAHLLPVNPLLSLFEEDFSVSGDSSADSSRSAEQRAGPGAFCIPSSVARWPISCLGIAVRFHSTLAENGVHTIGDLDGWTPERLRLLDGMGRQGAGAIQKEIAVLSDQAIEHCLRKDAKGHPLLPNARLGLFVAVASATTPHEEIKALVQGYSERNADAAHRRWSRPSGQQVTLDEVADVYGITRERVRQITNVIDDGLRRSNLRLPRLSRIAEVVAEAGGALPTGELIARAASAGEAIELATLELMTSISELGLIPHIAYNRKLKVWVTEKGEADWIENGRLSTALKTMTKALRTALYRTGCIRLEELDQGPFGAEHMLQILGTAGVNGRNRSKMKFENVSEYLVAIPGADSILSNYVVEMLTVTESLSLEELRAGLRRGWVTVRGGRIRLEQLPYEVFRAVLEAHSYFGIEGENVRLTVPPPPGIISRAERIVIDLLEQRGGLALWSDIMEAADRMSLSRATVAYVLSRPFVVKRGEGLYGLRGRPVDPETLRSRLKERAAAKRQTVKGVSYAGGTAARVVYELTSFSISGVLPVPGKLRNLARTVWRARVPGGREFELRMSKGFIWSLRKWFVADGAQIGDLIVATFDIREGLIEFDPAS